MREKRTLLESQESQQSLIRYEFHEINEFGNILCYVFQFVRNLLFNVYFSRCNVMKRINIVRAIQKKALFDTLYI